MIILLISLLFFSFKSSNYTKIKKGERVVINKHNISILQQKLNQKLDGNWFVFANKYSLSIYYGSKCKRVYDSLSSGSKTIDRLELFNDIGPDSVCYYNSRINTSRDKNLKANGIIHFTILIQKEWTKERYQDALNKNENNKQLILKNSSTKINKAIFSDYRFWVPSKKDFKTTLTNQEFHFLRLPYRSKYYQNSIFITPDRPNFYDEINWSKKAKKNKDKALKSIAKALGIKDYKILN